MSGHSPEEIRQHLRTYVLVFIALLFLTVVTVAISYIHLPFVQAVILALIVASIKASLVALFFMHLIDEKRIIYSTIALTGVLFIFLMSISLYA